MPGGSESSVTKKFAAPLRNAGWLETKVQTRTILRLKEGKKKARVIPVGKSLDGHKIDFVKGRVAFDFEWNSKDQTFDRDLFALRLFHEYHLISLGVLCTRSEKLNEVFDKLPLRNKDGSLDLDESGNPKPVKTKYGATTTWIGKLLNRLNSGRHGACPVLVFAITPKIISDWP